MTYRTVHSSCIIVQCVRAFCLQPPSFTGACLFVPKGHYIVLTYFGFPTPPQQSAAASTDARDLAADAAGSQLQQRHEVPPDGWAHTLFFPIVIESDIDDMTPAVSC